ncbi:hypothetical protein ACFE04_006737 [Oxalis oulophora]
MKKIDPYTQTLLTLAGKNLKVLGSWHILSTIASLYTKPSIDRTLQSRGPQILYTSLEDIENGNEHQEPPPPPNYCYKRKCKFDCSGSLADHFKSNMKHVKCQQNHRCDKCNNLFETDVDLQKHKTEECKHS